MLHLKGNQPFDADLCLSASGRCIEQGPRKHGSLHIQDSLIFFCLSLLHREQLTLQIHLCFLHIGKVQKGLAEFR